MVRAHFKVLKATENVKIKILMLKSYLIVVWFFFLLKYINLKCFPGFILSYLKRSELVRTK